MSRKGLRQTIFICAGIIEEQLITMIVAATSQDEAAKIYQDKYIQQPKEILGPFYKKRTQVLENTRTLKFSNQTQKAIYNEWLVNAFLLKEPEKQAYLVFIHRQDGKKSNPPKGTVVVPISDLKFI